MSHAVAMPATHIAGWKVPDSKRVLRGVASPMRVSECRAGGANVWEWVNRISLPWSWAQAGRGSLPAVWRAGHRAVPEATG